MRGNRRLEGMTDGQASGRTLAEQKESRRVAAVSSSTSPFGQNEWLVEEMYRKFREDPSSVDPSWHEFLVDYSPESTTGTSDDTGDGQHATAPREPGPRPRRRPQQATAPPPSREAPPTGAAKAEPAPAKRKHHRP